MSAITLHIQIKTHILSYIVSRTCDVRHSPTLHLESELQRLLVFAAFGY